MPTGTLAARRGVFPTRRRVLLLALPVALTVLGVGAWMVWPSAITAENGDKIRVGMTRVQVEAILGGPERNEFTGWVDLDGMGIKLDEDVRPGVWASESAVIFVTFDDNGLVSSFSCNACRPARGLFVRLLLRLLGR